MSEVRNSQFRWNCTTRTGNSARDEHNGIHLDSASVVFVKVESVTQCLSLPSEDSWDTAQSANL